MQVFISSYENTLVENIPNAQLALSQRKSFRFKGLEFGAGIFFVDSRAGGLDNSFEVLSYTRMDAALYDTKNNFRAALNFKNLFDVECFERVHNRRSVISGIPLTVLAVVSWEF